MWRDVLCIFIGGGFGSVCRYAIGAWLLKGIRVPFPFATFTANAIGCLCIGLFLGYWAGKPNHWLHLLLVTGFCGGFTTFSTFSNESVQLLREGSFGIAALYIITSLVVGLVMVFVGAMLTK